MSHLIILFGYYVGFNSGNLVGIREGIWSTRIRVERIQGKTRSGLSLEKVSIILSN